MTRTAGGSTALDRAITRTLVRAMGRPAIEVALWDGYRVRGSEPCVATARFLDRGALYRLIRNPELEFGELYGEGRLVVDGDLVDFLVAVHDVQGVLRDRTPLGWLRRLHDHRPSNSLSQARENIHHHYDLGNEFYERWLDRRMQYTCAYFPSPAMSLEDAQLAKLDHVCRKLQLEPGDRVVEAGFGWGGLALHMAKEYGAKVKAYNISREQVRYARARAEKEGLAGQVEYIEDDYRNITGEFDVFVSVGMLEHVGVVNYEALGGVIGRVLKPDGRGLIHSIGRNQPRRTNAWIDKRIFPGGHPATLREMMSVFEPFGLSVLDVENLRLHYARTLEHWLERFEANRESVTETFDEFFTRAWRLYLAGSIAAFRCGGLQLFQVVFARERNNEIPWTRGHVYGR